jgi:glycosyltransferase involved in cell wall biosynthesis
MEINASKNSKKIIIISAINIRSGGPLTILKNCLKELSESPHNKEYHIIALVYSKNNCYFNNITYLEFPRAENRIYSYFMEYYGLKKLSKRINPTLWISLTDKTPNVITNKLVVYLHNPTPFFHLKLKDFIYSPFLLLYVLFYKKVCSINIHKNDYLIVQQNWLRDAYSNLFSFSKKRCIVFPPVSRPKTLNDIYTNENLDKKTFIFASLPRGFKNFEIICEANRILLNRGITDHNIVLTLKGDESRYAKSIVRKYRVSNENISFIGVVSPDKLNELYNLSDCLIFPSRLETWGLPISEFSVYNKPMLIADLPYAHNTAAGSKYVAFFNPHSATQLAAYMEKIITNDFSFLKEVSIPKIENPHSFSWEETINLITNDKS